MELALKPRSSDFKHWNKKRKYFIVLKNIQSKIYRRFSGIGSFPEKIK